MADPFQDYFYAHPLQAVLRVVWIVLQVMFSAGLSAFLAWGPGNLDGTPVLLCGLAGAVLAGVAWGYQACRVVQGSRRQGRRLWNALAGSLLVFLTAGASVLLALEIQFGQIPLPGERREQAFERLWKAMDQAYPYFDEKGIAWRQLHDEYLPLVELAPDDPSFFALIASMLKELGDSHTMVEDPWFLPSCCFARADQIEGAAIVTRLTPHAQKSGLQIGDTLQSVEGKSIPQVIAEMQFLRGASSAWQQDYWDYSRLLPIPEDGSLQVTVEHADGSSADLTLVYDPDLAGADGTIPAVTYRQLSPETGYIRISRFANLEGEDLVADFDHAVDALMSTAGLVLDLRGNGGGDSQLSDALAGRLMNSRFIYGTEQYRVPLPMHAFRSSLDMSVFPRQPVYPGRLVVLMDAGTLSSSEWMIAALVDSGRAVTAGRRTGGGSGSPILFTMPGGVIKFSTGKFVRNNGSLIEGVGFIPDYPVAWTISDVREGRDPDLEAAIVILGH